MSSPFQKTNYGRVAHVYDRIEALSGDVIEKTRNAFLGELPFRPLNPIIVGCGTGTFSSAFLKAEQPDQLTINDIAPEMLALSRRRVAETGWKGILHEVPGDISQLNLPARYDFVSLQFVLNCFSNKRRVELLQQVMKLLAPGGVLYICDYSRPRSVWMKPVFYANYFAAVLLFWPLAGNAPNRPGNMEQVILDAGLLIDKKRSFSGELYSAWLTRLPPPVRESTTP